MPQLLVHATLRLRADPAGTFLRSSILSFKGGWTGPISYISRSDRMRNARAFQTVSPIEPPAVIVMKSNSDRVDFAAMKNMLFANESRYNP